MGNAHAGNKDELQAVLERNAPALKKLKISNGRVRKLWRLFNKIDRDHSGAVSISEFLSFLGAPRQRHCVACRALIPPAPPPAQRSRTPTTRAACSPS